MADPVGTGERSYRGIPVSAGICHGKLLVLPADDLQPAPRRPIAPAALPDQARRLEQALAATREQIHDMQRRVAASLGPRDATIFDAHVLVLEDPVVIEEVNRFMQENLVGAEYAYQEVTNKYARTLSNLGDEYLRERAADLHDVAARVLRNLAGHRDTVDLSRLSEPCLIVSHDLSPSRTAMLDKKKVLGFITEVGAKTSHTAILARALRIPAIVGVPNACRLVATGEDALLDGFNGQLILSPTDQTLFEYGQLVRRRASLEERLRETVTQPAQTLDGVPITLSANVENAVDETDVRSSGAEGIGLFRTEYLFLNQEQTPTEDEQYQQYRQAAAALKPAPVIIRTLDLGGDKFVAHLNAPQEMNPFLGWRAIRFCLQERELFRAQLRAILRASAEGNVKIMYPMISGVTEVDAANALLEAYKQELRQEGVAFDEKIEIGAMIEIPSAVLTADALAQRVQFFSLGTNDLIQYTLAVDRMNQRIAHLYEPTHPAVIRLIHLTVEAGRRHRIWTGVCGEMAGDPFMTPLLIGLGATELSAAPALIPSIKHVIRRVTMRDAQELAAMALQNDSASEILAQCQHLTRKIAPQLFEQLSESKP